MYFSLRIFANIMAQSGRTFRLYPEERHFWSFLDYGAVLDMVETLKPARVLEFGPGSSTLALIEGGAGEIDSCEDDPHWGSVYAERIARVYPQVTIRPYLWTDPVYVHGVSGRYDFALIDGPFGTVRRPAVIEYCLDRCAVVMIAREDSKGNGLTDAINEIAGQRGLPIDILHTGPLSGSFAVLRP